MRLKRIEIPAHPQSWALRRQRFCPLLLYLSPGFIAEQKEKHDSGIRKSSLQTPVLKLSDMVIDLPSNRASSGSWYCQLLTVGVALQNVLTF